MVSLLKLFLVLSECRVVYTRTLYDHVPSSAALSSLNVELNQTLWSTTLPKKRSSTSGIFIGISWQIDLRKTQHVQIICQNKPLSTSSSVCTAQLKLLLNLKLADPCSLQGPLPARVSGRVLVQLLHIPGTVSWSNVERNLRYCRVLFFVFGLQHHVHHQG